MSLISPEFVFQHQLQGFSNCFPPDESSRCIERTSPWGLSQSQQVKSDNDFSKSFILNIQKKKRTKIRPIKISDGKLILENIVKEKKNLEKDAGNLNVNDENFDLKWESLVKSVCEIKGNINRFEKDMKSQIETSVFKRLEKRKKAMKRKLKYKMLKQKYEEKKKKKHEIIDKLLRKAGKEVEGVKREAALKRQADSVLHEVRKKKFDGIKMLNLLSGLAKLRALRSKKEEERGGYCSDKLTKTFNQVITRFQKLWQNQIEVYKLEEKGLKIMLEENTLPYVGQPKFQSNLLLWEEVLFGSAANDSSNPTNTSIENFMAVRSDWDQFATQKSTPMASGIPIGWTLPSNTQDEQWKIFFENPKASPR